MLRHLSAAAVVAALLCAGCASYTTPGGPAKFADIGRSDAATEGVRLPSPHFPARVAVVRVQAPQYKSFTSDSYGKGRYSVVSTQELLTDDAVQAMAKWPSVEGITPLSPALLPAKLETLDDLRLAAAKLQADIMLICTMDTVFELHGKAVEPMKSLPLGDKPGDDAALRSIASVEFTDVRTGFSYGSAQVSASASDLGSAWGKPERVDAKRIDTERAAFTQLLAEAQKTWEGIATRYR